MNEIEIRQKHHEAIIRQMKIGNIATAVIATASLITIVAVFTKIMK